MANKTVVYILGAGASAADGAPVTTELVLNTCLNFWSKPQTGATLSEFRPVLKEMDKMFGTNLEDVFVKVSSTGRLTGNWAAAYDKIDLEEFLIHITNMSKKKDGKLKRLERQAYYFIFNPLCYETNTIGLRALKHYTAFVEKVLKRGLRHCIITFNYDTLLERAMTHSMFFSFPKGQGLRWTYAVGSTYDGPRIPYYAKDESVTEIFLLKLHGSFNWGLCPEKKEITMYAPVPSAYQYQGFHDGQNLCHGGEHKQQPLIIPPTREKDIDVPGIKTVWNKARYFLAEASEVHVIGYSLPDADEGAYKLLETLKHRKIERVVLANPDIGHRDKFKKLIGENSSSYQEYNSFKDYLVEEYHTDLNEYTNALFSY